MYECYKKHACGKIPYHLHTINFFLLYSSITIIVSAIKTVGFSRVRQTLSKIFAMH